MRVESIDILRGLALLGILIAHMLSNFSGWPFMSSEQKETLHFASINEGISDWVRYIFNDKSRALFAFMFGVSFFFQLRKHQISGNNLSGPFLKRLGVLLVFGLIHAHLLFGPDILRYYAVGGLVLLVSYRWPSKYLLGLGTLLAVIVPTVSLGVIVAYNYSLYSSFPPLETVFSLVLSSSFLDNLTINHLLANLRYHWILLSLYAVPVSGIFLFGLWMARQGYLHEGRKHLKALKSIMFVGLVLGVCLQFLALQIREMFANQTLEFSIPVFMARALLDQTAPILLMLGFVASVTLLCLYPKWSRILSFLAPAGRMTLTNYIMQSVFAWVIFFGSGLGWYFRFGALELLVLGFVIFAFQVWFSHWWLRRFSMGPLEWVWRWAIRGSRPSFKLAFPS